MRLKVQEIYGSETLFFVDTPLGQSHIWVSLKALLNTSLKALLNTTIPAPKEMTEEQLGCFLK